MTPTATEITVALIGAGALMLAGFVSAITAYLTARRQTRNHEKQADVEFLAARDKLLWEQAGRFWDERAADLTSSVHLERSAREAETTALKADIALLKSDNARLSQSHLECEGRLKGMEARLSRAGEQLQVAGQAIEEVVKAQ